MGVEYVMKLIRFFSCVPRKLSDSASRRRATCVCDVRVSDRMSQQAVRYHSGHVLQWEQRGPRRHHRPSVRRVTS